MGNKLNYPLQILLVRKIIRLFEINIFEVGIISLKLDAQGFILVFALNDISAFEEAKKLKDQIFRIKQAKVPIVLCGNKCVL